VPNFHLFTLPNGLFVSLSLLTSMESSVTVASPLPDKIFLSAAGGSDEKSIGGSSGVKGSMSTELLEELEAEVRNGSLHSKAIIAEAVSLCYFEPNLLSVLKAARGRTSQCSPPPSPDTQNLPRNLHPLRSSLSRPLLDSALSASCKSTQGVMDITTVSSSQVV
jgi:hypothetical protein